MEWPSSDSAAVDEIKDLLTCSLCSKTLNEPRNLACLHNFCKVCLEKYVGRLGGGDKTIETFPCPTCCSEFTLKSNQNVAELASSHFIKNMLEIMAIKEKAKTSATCFRCQDPGINHCATCKVFMCIKCTEIHDDWPTHKNHNVLSLDEVSDAESELKLKRKLYCMKHKDKILEIYCKTCQELCCVYCLVLNHQKENHSCVTVSDMGKELRATLRSNCTTLDIKLSKGKKALNNICEVMKSLEKNAKTAKEQIREQKENILKVVAEKLDQKAKEMNVEVDEIYGELHSQLSKQHDEIKNYVDKVQASVLLPKNLLKRANTEEILSSQILINEKIRKLEHETPENLDAVNDGGVQYVPGDIGMINVDEIVDSLGFVEGGVSATTYKMKRSSSILKGEIAFIKQLQKWLKEKCKWNLCYKASTNGWRAKEFHRHCDRKGPTLVLVKANECIFGGYTDQHWSGGGYKRSNSSFLFSLRNKDNLGPFIANIKQGQEQSAVYCKSGNGPTFGGGHDLCIFDNPQSNQSSYSNFGDTYQLPSGYLCGTEQAKNLLAGQYSFLTTEIEVYN